jgi:hypothetical protein
VPLNYAGQHAHDMRWFRLRFLGLTVLLSLIFALAVALVHRPCDVSALRAFLSPPEGCAAPCFMDVRLGITRAEDAITALQAHEWVGDLYQHLDGFYLDWSWSGVQPPFINTRHIGFLGERSALTGVYHTMTIDSTITLGEVLLVLGKPDYSFFGRAERVRSRVMIHSVYYTQLGFQADGEINCPIRLSRMLEIPVTLYWGTLIAREPAYPVSEYTFPNYPRAWLKSLPLC